MKQLQWSRFVDFSSLLSCPLHFRFFAHFRSIPGWACCCCCCCYFSHSTRPLDIKQRGYILRVPTIFFLLLWTTLTRHPCIICTTHCCSTVPIRVTYMRTNIKYKQLYWWIFVSGNENDLGGRYRYKNIKLHRWGTGKCSMFILLYVFVCYFSALHAIMVLLNISLSIHWEQSKLLLLIFFLFLLIKTFLLFFSSFFIFYQPSSHELCLIVVTHRKFTNETTIFVSSNTRQAETFKIRYRFSFLLNRIRWIGLHLIVEHLVKMRRNWYSSEALAIQMNFQFYKQSRWNRECDTKGREREIESDRDKER